MTPKEIEARTNKYFAHFPRMELKRVKLREVRNSDVQDYYDYILHPKVSRFVPVDCWPSSIKWVEDHLKYWRNNFIHQAGICWVLADIETDQMIGSITLTRLMAIQRKATLSYDLNYDYWGKGLMREALTAVMNFCDKDLELLRLYACAATTNERSLNLLRALGFKSEGLMIKYDVLAQTPGEKNERWKHEDFESFGRILGVK